MARCNYWLERDWTFVMMYSSWHQDKSNMLGKSYLLSFSQPRTFPLTIKLSGFPRTNTLKSAQHIRSGMNYEHSTNGMLLHGLKTGLHYQSFCDHRRYFAKVNSKFWMICKKCLRKLKSSLFNTDSVSPNISYKILQNLEFTYAKFLLWSQKLWQCKPALKQKKINRDIPSNQSNHSDT
jgi:hypothetical protein